LQAQCQSDLSGLGISTPANLLPALTMCIPAFPAHHATYARQIRSKAEKKRWENAP